MARVHCFRSLRTRVLGALAATMVTTFIIFFVVGIVLIMLLTDIDKNEGRNNAVRVARNLYDAIQTFYKTEDIYSTSDSLATIVALAQAGNGSTTLVRMWASELFLRLGGTTQLGFLGVYTLNCTTIYTVAYNKSGSSVAPDAYYGSAGGLSQSCSDTHPSYGGIVTPVGGDSMVYAIRPAKFRDGRMVGYLAIGRKARMASSLIARAVTPACVTMYSPYEPKTGDASGPASGLEPTTLPSPHEDWRGHIATRVVSDSTLRHNDPLKRRICEQRKGNTSQDTAAYFMIKSNISGLPDGPLIRVDTPQKGLHAGTIVIAIESSIIGGLVVLLSILSFLLLHFVVLKRLERITRAVRNMKLSMNKTDRELLIGSQMARDIGVVDDTSSTESLSGDEIGELSAVLHRKMEGMKERLNRTAQALEENRQRCDIDAGTLAALGQCCWMSYGVPAGVAPCAAPKNRKMSVEALLQSPIATECLKVFTRQDQSMEHVQFLIDVVVFKDIHLAATMEAALDPFKTEALLVQAAGAADSIMKQFIVTGAPMQVNISAPVLRSLEGHDGRDPALFDAAFREVMALVQSDIMPRFAESDAYIAMMFMLEAENASTPNATLLRALGSAITHHEAKRYATFSADTRSPRSVPAGTTTPVSCMSSFAAPQFTSVGEPRHDIKGLAAVPAPHVVERGPPIGVEKSPRSLGSPYNLTESSPRIANAVGGSSASDLVALGQEGSFTRKSSTSLMNHLEPTQIS
eukprot:m51a1_g8407 hypothetical protein (746) ;mRNA; r:254846-258059